MYEKYTTEGFVVGSRNFGEADKIIFVFTEDFGLINVLFKSVRNIKSKFKAFTEVGLKIKITVVKGKGIWRATGVECDFLRKLTKESLKHFVRPLLFIKKLIHGEEKNSDLFRSIDEAFTFLKQVDFDLEDLNSFETVFSLRIIASLGYIGAMDKDKNISLVGNFSKNDISIAKQNQKEIIKIINMALKETHLMGGKL